MYSGYFKRLYKRWLMARSKAKNRKNFRGGFSWAMTKYFIDKASLAELSEHARPSGSAFDLGVLKAVRIIHDIELLKLHKPTEGPLWKLFMK